MATPDPLLSLPSAEVDTLLNILQGVYATRLLGIGSFCLMIYDYFLTLDQEIEYYWSGKWTTTRVLFFLVSATESFCGFCIIVMRLWYLYSRNNYARALIVTAFTICASTEFALLGITWHELRPQPIPIPGLKILGCNAPLAPHLWRIYITCFIIHTILFAATTFQAVRVRHSGKKNQVMDRILRDGGAAYIIIFITVGFAGIGSVQKAPKVSIPSMYSNFMPSILSVAISRLMFSIQNLAANLHLDATWLLSHAEMSRVRWKKGSHEGELIVEVDSADSDEWFPTTTGGLEPGMEMNTVRKAKETRVYTTRIEEIPVRMIYTDANRGRGHWGSRGRKMGNLKAGTPGTGTGRGRSSDWKFPLYGSPIDLDDIEVDVDDHTTIRATPTPRTPTFLGTGRLDSKDDELEVYSSWLDSDR
ncbi:hypothetical protein C8Q75DRAFT_718343 [Abortiporus biennis]|nr:hypothetical protein C8Q75DRAFT_718343 [Abortiporus biennis]